MGTETTDFFLLHRNQCADYGSRLRSKDGAEAIVAEMDLAVVQCQEAIDAGGDKSYVITATPVKTAALFSSLPALTKTDFLKPGPEKK